MKIVNFLKFSFKTIFPFFWSFSVSLAAGQKKKPTPRYDLFSRSLTTETVQLFCIYGVHFCLLLMLESIPSLIIVRWIARVWSFMVGLYTLKDWIDWNREFRHRPKRGDLTCPSNSRRPDLKENSGGAAARFNNLPFNLRNTNVFKGTCSMPMDSTKTTQKNEKKVFRRFGTAETFVSVNTFPSDKRSDELSMDHLYMSFSDYHWCSWFLMPSIISTFLVGGPQTGGAAGIVKMWVSEWLGLTVKDSPDRAEKILMELVLNTSLAAWIGDIDEQDDGTITGQLLVPSATHILPDKTVTSGQFQLNMDFTKGKINKATFDGESLDLNDAITLAFIVGAGHTHPVIHSYANWGINPDAEDSFIRRMAVCTIAWNNIGVERFQRMLELLRKIGLTKFTTPDVTRLVLHQGPHTVPPHAHLLRLQKHSKFVKFIIKVRSYFLHEFVRHQEDFPGIDGEALFIGTVMHSIDHQQMVHQLDINSLRGTDQFVADRDWATVTLSCFVDRPSFRMFECRFSHAPHPFYRSVYNYAVTIDTRLAAMMECTIAM